MLVVTFEEVMVVVWGEVTVVITVVVVVSTCVVAEVVVIVLAVGPGTVVVVVVRLPTPAKYPTTPTSTAMTTIAPMAVVELVTALLKVTFMSISFLDSVTVAIVDATGAHACCDCGRCDGRCDRRS